ncbi:hypothetical protein L7F22_031135 [Adiantum nelumboides]|nr:hypothetical protein [Adiantum nelumboides]
MQFACPLPEVCKSRHSLSFLRWSLLYFAPIDCVRNVCNEAEGDDRLHSLLCCHRAGVPIASNTLLYALQHCNKNKDLLACKQIHAVMISAGFSSTLTDIHHDCIHLFAQCSALLDANLIFASAEEPNVFSWHAIISAHITLEKFQAALVLYFWMLDTGLKPNKLTYSCALKACSNTRALEHGRLIHGDILRHSLESGVVVGTILVNLYAACGDLEDARAAFLKLSSKNIVSWGALISGYTQHGKSLLALEHYEEMQNTGLTPDDYLFSCALKACGSIQAITLGLLIHDKIIRQNGEGNVVLGNTLIDMYAKCGDLTDGQKVFNSLPNKTSVTWSAILAGCVFNGDTHLAFEIYSKLEMDGVRLNTFICSSLLRACGQMSDMNKGKSLHDNIIKIGHDDDLVVGNALIDMYIRCGGVEEAHMLFDNTWNKDDVAWGTIISGCVQANNPLAALSLFERMQREGRVGNSITFSSAIQACGGIRGYTEGKLIHFQIISQGLESDNVVGSTLVDMYAKCACLREAWNVFKGLRTKTLPSWGALIDGFASQENYGQLALDMFQIMQEECNEPNIVLHSSALKACCTIGAFQEARLIHHQIICSGLKIDLVAGNALVDMYIRSGSMDGANKVFDEIINRDIITWNSLISGCTELCHFSRALELFWDLQKDNISPDRITILSCLKACGGVCCLAQGRLLHLCVHLGVIEMDLSMGNALMDMYSRCGSMEDAERVFADMPMVDVISWGTIIAGYALQGRVEMVEHYFHNMRMQGMMADEGIFTSIFSACRLVGYLSEARRSFVSMREDCIITPNKLHFNCMSDLIARTGQLYDAQKFLTSMPTEADNTCWMSLLTSCKAYGNVKLGRKCFEEAILIEPDCAAGYILMWGIYADAQQWEEADKIMKLKQLAGVSWAEDECEIMF